MQTLLANLGFHAAERKSIGINTTVKWTGSDKSVGRPLLIIDGNSFARRAYRALPRSIR
jgi:hypothetical protein